MKVPYTQQFTPKVTPLNRLIPILRTNAGKPKDLKKGIASAFFQKSPDPTKMAGNTLIALRNCGILGDGDNLTDLGQQILAQQDNIDEAHRILARHFLLNLDGIAIVETLREMQSGGTKIELTTIPGELRKIGFTGVSDNSSDLSGVLGWLRAGNVFTGLYSVNPTGYYSLIGTSANTLSALKDLSSNQIAFLKSMAALNIQDWTPYMTIVDHAVALHPGEISFNKKVVPKDVCEPLAAAGFIEFRKKEKVDKKTAAGRGGKTGDVKPTDLFEKGVAAPLVDALYRAAGFTKIRSIRAMSLDDIIADINQTDDPNKQGKALEYLTVRLCQMLELEFMGWCETDGEIEDGREVSMLWHSAQLIDSRWQVTCKAGPITFDMLARAMGLQAVSRANVILLTSTRRATREALSFRELVLRNSNLTVIFCDRNDLQRIVNNDLSIGQIINEQAQDAVKFKPSFVSVYKRPLERSQAA